ncbi:hypothetical protein M408DRAFT_12203 [Serendipita vermifera MAFF 305830]|uniref:Uncharacterized protein n=1 Tax=Serendipita vermifera MAFF 305830 TaxID=933852 RepID=A0A0C3AQ48_SERVB|nr:hypothetical protein M408DRAFT_12203 [Serendipita vermifera MAFF 305830]
MRHFGQVKSSYHYGGRPCRIIQSFDPTFDGIRQDVYSALNQSELDAAAALQCAEYAFFIFGFHIYDVVDDNGWGQVVVWRNGPTLGAVAILRSSNSLANYAMSIFLDSLPPGGGATALALVEAIGWSHVLGPGFERKRVEVGQCETITHVSSLKDNA